MRYFSDADGNELYNNASARLTAILIYTNSGHRSCKMKKEKIYLRILFCCVLQDLSMCGGVQREQ